MPIRLKVVTEPRPNDPLFPYDLMILALEEAEPGDTGVHHKLKLAVPGTTLAQPPTPRPTHDQVGVVQDATEMGAGAVGMTRLSWNRVRLTGRIGVRVPVHREPGAGSTIRVILRSRTLEPSASTPAGTDLSHQEIVNLR